MEPKQQEVSEIDKFFESLPNDRKSTEEPEKEAPQGTALQAPEEGDNKGTVPTDDEHRKNRRHRRLEEQLERERRSNIALNDRIRALSSSGGNGNQSTTPNDMPSEWVALMGDTPEARRAWELQNRLLQKAVEQGKTEAVRELREEQDKALKEQARFENFIDEELESIEDGHNVDLTSDAPAARKARKEFLELIREISPKDENGKIISYADFESTFKLYQKSKANTPSNRTVERQKEIASKTMQAPSGNAIIDAPKGPMNWATARNALNKLIN